MNVLSINLPGNATQYELINAILKMTAAINVQADKLDILREQFEKHLQSLKKVKA